jgi:hypothetical protein
MMRFAWFALGWVFLALACQDKAKVSTEHARQHAELLAETVKTDVEEVRQGMPQAIQHLAPLYAAETAPQDDLPAVRSALELARAKVQDLRIAKSTFFALADESGTVLRNDQQQDLMAGKNLFTSFPELRQALSGKYVETRGAMPEAARVKGNDGQWVAAHPITVEGKVRGLYVTGWSWSAYAYRLENAARGKARSDLPSSAREPLIYVYVLVGDQAFGAPISPEINARAILDLKPLGKLQGDAVFSSTLEITGRDFGLAIKATPLLGAETAVAVLRSET